VSRPLGGTELKRLHREWRRRTDARLALLLDGVQSPYNLGAIVRTAAAFGVEHLYLAGATASPAAPGSRKVSLGTERYLTWTGFPDGPEAARAAEADGLTVVGVELTDDATPIQDADLPTDLCLAIGHEDRGLSSSLLAVLEQVVYVPQVGRVGSLNVATAAAIALYEARRQRWTASDGEIAP
jgi:tRNA (guanosine-2'-O-)-methyltransferase